MSFDLPSGWAFSTFADISAYIQRGKSPKYSDKSTCPVINQKCIRWHGLECQHLKYIQKDQWNGLSEERFLQEGDLLWNSTGTGTIGRACLFRTAYVNKAVVDSHVTIVRFPRNLMSPEYVFYYVMSPYIQKEIENMQAGSTNQVELGRAVILSKPIPVAPLNEQIRIVDKIERLFSNLDEGEALLKQVQQQLATYRQSVLKAAVTGELTKDWREANQHRLESGEALLQRILTSRRKNWQGRGKYKEPVTPDATNLPELPDGWVWVTLDALAAEIITGPFGSSLHKSDYVENGIPIINPINIQNGKITPDHSVTVSAQTLGEMERFRVKTGDVVFGRRGEMGRCALITSMEDGWLCGTGSLILRPTDAINPEYLVSVLSGVEVKAYLEKNCVGSTMKNLNQQILLSITIAVPSHSEQTEAVDRASTLFSQIAALETWCVTELARSATLRQSILKDAFSGKLVPQDPGDEPASELLKRIRAQKENMNQPKRTTRRTKATA